MIIVNEFIWRSDHYAFHLTNKKAIGSISKQGLKPLCGKRSKSVGDDTKGIYFFDCLGSVTDWIEALYENKLSVVFEDINLARETLDNVREFIRNHPTVYISTHTPLGYENLENNKVMDLDNPPKTIQPEKV
mgnify:CR=1 FL=1